MKTMLQEKDTLIKTLGRKGKEAEAELEDAQSDKKAYANKITELEKDLADLTEQMPNKIRAAKEVMEEVRNKMKLAG